MQCDQHSTMHGQQLVGDSAALRNSRHLGSVSRARLSLRARRRPRRQYGYAHEMSLLDRRSNMRAASEFICQMRRLYCRMRAARLRETAGRGVLRKA
jgi:hypothetical protein